MKKIVSGLWFIFFIFNCYAHPLHVTIANIDLSGDTLKTSIRFFEDDLTNILMHEGLICKGQSLNDSTLKLDKVFEAFIEKYFIMRMGDKDIHLSYIANEKGELTITLYFETRLPKKKKTLQLTNLLMTRYFSDQKNLLIINIEGNEKGIEMNNQKTTETFYL